MPGAGVGALSLGPRAHPVPVGLAVLPAAAVGAPVVEVEPSAVDLGGRGGGGFRRARRPRGRGTLGRRRWGPGVHHITRALQLPLRASADHSSLLRTLVCAHPHRCWRPVNTFRAPAC